MSLERYLQESLQSINENKDFLKPSGTSHPIMFSDVSTYIQQLGLESQSLLDAFKSLNTFVKKNETYSPEKEMAAILIIRQMWNLVLSFDATGAGKLFETFLGALAGVEITGMESQTIEDFSTSGGQSYSVKLLQSGGRIKGSTTNLINKLAGTSYTQEELAKLSLRTIKDKIKNKTKFHYIIASKISPKGESTNKITFHKILAKDLVIAFLEKNGFEKQINLTIPTLEDLEVPMQSLLILSKDNLEKTENQKTKKLLKFVDDTRDLADKVYSGITNYATEENSTAKGNYIRAAKKNTDALKEKLNNPLMGE